MKIIYKTVKRMSVVLCAYKEARGPDPPSPPNCPKILQKTSQISKALVASVAPFRTEIF